MEDDQKNDPLEDFEEHHKDVVSKVESDYQKEQEKKRAIEYIISELNGVLRDMADLKHQSFKKKFSSKHIRQTRRGIGFEDHYYRAFVDLPGYVLPHATTFTDKYMKEGEKSFFPDHLSPVKNGFSRFMLTSDLTEKNLDKVYKSIKSEINTVIEALTAELVGINSETFESSNGHFNLAKASKGGPRKLLDKAIALLKRRESHERLETPENIEYLKDNALPKLREAVNNYPAPLIKRVNEDIQGIRKTVKDIYDTIDKQFADPRVRNVIQTSYSPIISKAENVYRGVDNLHNLITEVEKLCDEILDLFKRKNGLENKISEISRIDEQIQYVATREDHAQILGFDEADIEEQVKITSELQSKKQELKDKLGDIYNAIEELPK